MSREADLLAFFGHHKGATTWVNSILAHVCREMGLRYADVHNPRLFNHELGAFVEKGRIEFLAYTNADYAFAQQLRDFRGFHVIRDPRDIVVSAYFSHRYSHPADRWPELAEHRAKLQQLTKDEGLIAEMQFRREQLGRMCAWDYALPHVMLVKYEDLVKNPYQRFVEIFRFLGLLDETYYGVKKRLKYLLLLTVRRLEAMSKRSPASPFLYPHRQLPAERLLGILYENDFAKKAGGRKLGVEDVKSHYRKGIPGDWVNHFTPEHVAFFKSHYNDVLVKLGYEQDDNW